MPGIKELLHKWTAPEVQVEKVETNNKDKDGDEPWVEVVSDGLDPLKGLHMKLDWNDHFIVYLRTHGYTGASDETVVGKWLVDLYKHISDQLESTQRNAFE
jgi:hypothetical protein